MPIYIEFKMIRAEDGANSRAPFSPRFSGGVRVATHPGSSHEDRIHGWYKVQEIRVGGSPPAGTAPGTNAITITMARDVIPPAWLLARRPCTTARMDFTRADGRGGEVLELSIALHDAAIDRDAMRAQSGRGSAAGERFRLRYTSMTCSNLAQPLPAMSQIVTALLARASTGHHQPGGMIVAMGDGSVRFHTYSWAWTVRR